MTLGVGLRERKKRQTRDAIIESAMRLFGERGFEETTIVDIAEAAGVAPRTFFAYFPSKEDVVFSETDGALDAMRACFDGRAEDEGAVDALRTFVELMVVEFDPTDEREILRRRLATDNVSVAHYERAMRGRFIDQLAEALEVDFSGPRRELRAKMVASAAITALTTLTEDPDRADELFGTDPMAIVDEALAFVRGGIAALESR